MHITIERKDGPVKTGLFSKAKAFMIDLSIKFSEEEQHAIQAANLKDYIILRRPFHPGYGVRNPETFAQIWLDRISVAVLSSIHKDGKPRTVFYADTKPEADIAEQQLRQGLVALKSQIEAANKPSGKESYEL